MLCANCGAHLGHIFEKEGELPEFLRYDLGAKVDDTWNYDDPYNSARNYTATMVSKAALVPTETFEFQDCYQYNYNVTLYGGLFVEIFLAKGIGFFRSYVGEGTTNDRGLLRVKIDVIFNFAAKIHRELGQLC